MSMVNNFTPNAYDVKINVLYFVSLTLALSVSSVCILGKQWIREYQKDISVSPCDAARVRQMRFDALQRWRVPQIMAALPVILLIALMLFFAGLLVQLWNISDKTTAAAVLVIVALTVLLVILTTTVPAWVSLRHDHSVFAPFRSPQAWIIFYIVRRLQHWYHSNDRYPQENIDWHGNWKAIHPILNSWAEFDLHFLKIEPQDWFEHKVSSVHCVLRWVAEVLRNSSEIEKSVLWCLQSKYHPKGLIEDGDELVRHVMRASNNTDMPKSPDRLQHDFSVQTQGHQRIDSSVGRYHAELLLRSAHHAIGDAPDNLQKAWEVIGDSYRRLRYHAIFDDYLEKEIVHLLTSSLTSPPSDQHIIQDQVALLFERMLTISPPSHSFRWGDTIGLLLKARHDSSSPLSRQILPDIIDRQLPAWIRTYKSASLLYRIGFATHDLSYVSWEHAIELFTHLDKLMVDMCRDPDGVDGLDEESVKKWEKLRLAFTQKTRDGNGISGWAAPDHLQLPDSYFDNLLGHGLLPALLTPRHHSSSSVVEDSSGDPLTS